MLATRIRAMGAAHWLVLFGLILAGWVVLWLMAIPAETRALSKIYGAEFWISLCLSTPSITGYFNLFLMWALMAAAMMLPTALPALATYDDLSQSTDTNFALLTTGYLVIWLGFASAGLAALIFYLCDIAPPAPQFKHQAAISQYQKTVTEAVLNTTDAISNLNTQVKIRENSKAKFSYVKSSHSNINFTNTIVESDAVNVVMFQYVYNGGGVGIGGVLEPLQAAPVIIEDNAFIGSRVV